MYCCLLQVATHKAEVMVASHNQDSIERTVAGMAARGLSPRGAGVYFGQLLGMSDNLTFTLGQHGYQAFKYVPYGPIDLVMPYLIRWVKVWAQLCHSLWHGLNMIQCTIGSIGDTAGLIAVAATED